MGFLKGIISIVAAVWICQAYKNPKTIQKIPKVGYLLSKMNPYLVVIVVLILLNMIL